MAELSGGQALVQALRREGVDTIFGLPGVQLDWLFDALYQEREHIRVIHTRHEQAAAYMADGFARTTGRVGVCLVVPGPGLLNAGAGLATAYACSSPVLAITGQIPSDLIGVGRGVLHEIPEQLRAAGSFSKWAARATRPAEIPRLAQEAFRQLRIGRPRPVVLEIPPDVLQATASVDPRDPAVDEPPSGDPDLIERAASLLGRAEHPVILSGGGVLGSGAWDELRLLAEMLQAPVVTSTNGRGALSDCHPLAQSTLALPGLVARSDAILAVGTRFTQPTSSTWPSGERPIIQIDVDPAEIGRNLKPTIAIVADARRALAQLIDRLPRHNRPRPARADEFVALKRWAEAQLETIQPQASLARAIRHAIPDDTIVVNESTQVGYWSNLGFPVYQPRTFLTSGYQGTLGYGFPTALGAQVGNPGRRVISINGDGGFMFNVQELSTAVRHRINVVAVIFDDGAYGNVRRIQRQQFDGHLIASDLQNPDFVKLAEAFGLAGRRAEGPEQLRAAVAEALRQDEPSLIVVPVDEMPSMWHLYRRPPPLPPPSPARQ